jgi:hypothetical protein
MQIGNLENFELIGWFHKERFLICLGNKDKNETAKEKPVGF